MASPSVDRVCCMGSDVLLGPWPLAPLAPGQLTGWGLKHDVRDRQATLDQPCTRSADRVGSPRTLAGAMAQSSGTSQRTSVREAARILGVSPTPVRRMVRAGTLQAACVLRP